MKIIQCLLAVGTSLQLLITSIQAADWNGSVSTEISNMLNWTGDPTTSNFRWNTGTWTTTAAANYSILTDALILGGVNTSVTFDFADTVNAGFFLISGTSPTATASLSLIGGTLATTHINIASDSSWKNPGMLTVDGATSSASASNRIEVGTRGTGSLSVLNGGSATAATLYLSVLDGGNGTVVVDDGSLAVTGIERIAGSPGFTNAATIEIKNGGSMSVTNPMILGGLNGLNTTTNISVTDNSDLTVGSYITLGGDLSNAGGTTNLTVGTGSSVVSSSHIIRVRGGGTLSLEGGTVRANAISLADANATIRGSGTVLSNAAGGDFLMNGKMNVGDTSLGVGVGTLTVGQVGTPTDLLMSGTSVSTFDFQSAALWDSVIIHGDITVDGILNLNFSYNMLSSTEFTLFSATGAHSGTFDEINWGGTATSGESGWDGSDFVIYNVVPEPSSAILMAIGLVCMSIRRRGRILPKTVGALSNNR